ncbi:MAG: TolC family protein [Pseudomonadota bacterium]
MQRYSRLWLALIALVGCSMVAPSAWSQYWQHDPFDTESKTVPAPGMRWESSRPLPAVTAPASPAQPSHAAPLSLAELTEFALRNNPKTRQAWYGARAAAAGVGVERADLLPQITASYGLTRVQPISATTGTVSSWQTRYGPSLSLGYVLFDFGVRSSQIQAAEYRLLASNLAQNRVLQDVVLLVEQAYYQLIGVEALVRVNEQSLKNNLTVLEAAQKRRESGLATVADVYRGETQVAQSRLNLTRSRGDFEKAKGQLANAVGLPVAGTLRVQALSESPQIREITASLNELLEQAKATRPDLVAAEAQARASRAAANATANAGLPSIEVAGLASRTSFWDDRPSGNSYNLGLSLRIPLFTGFRDTYSVRQAEAQAAQAEAARDLLYRQTQLDVWQSYYDLQTAASGTTSTEAQVKSAEQTAQATLARYQAGFGSILDLITAQQDESNARVQRIQSYLDWYTALARLNYSIGMNNIPAVTSETK